ncbi:MAG: hypothetical protein LBD21_07445 [Tannerellaceae bacterium]|jgi:hypothetical protein|nr:hypothetical protein [Tannerellaceae bacterium]
MQEEDYTFVTIDDDNDSYPSDAVIIDVDDDIMMEAVVIDEGMDSADFITLSDDTVVIMDTDMIDSYSSDISDMDISIII